jgi:zinc-binding alcohol dehydrogenase family protein
MMKAIGYIDSLSITNPNALFDTDVDRPVAEGHDLLVKVNAIAVNPVDYKIRQRVASTNGKPKIIGWDAVGRVIEVGEKVTHFKVGDAVYYAGDLNRQGSNAEYQRVDERIVGNKPKSLSDAEAAALPLTTITAWELLFEHLAIGYQAPEAKVRTDDVILVNGAAGGVGSILLQLIKNLTGATTIATASRDDSMAWVRKLGADYVIDYRQALAPQIQALGLSVTHVASLQSTGDYFDTYVEMLAPFGKIAMIDDLQEPVDVMKLKSKSLSLHLEFMFARSMYHAKDMNQQGCLLNSVAELIDQGHIKTTIRKHLGLINAENLRKAHEILESGKAIGKIVLEGFN